MNNLIRDIAACERPYEKAISHGVEALSDAELLAVIIRNGTREASSIDLANRILNVHAAHKGIVGLQYIRREELLKIKGIGDTKATQLLAVSELANRMSRSKLKKNVEFNNPDTIASYYIERCRYLTRENTFLMMFSNRNVLIKEIRISEGTINQALLSPREIYIEAVKHEAVSIVLVHNHPSGNPEPSQADIAITKKIYAAGYFLDIRLLDHIIVGSDSYVSMSERGLIE